MAHIRTRETYGTRRLRTELAENGIIVGRDRLARLRKELRLRCKQKRKFRATTNSNHNLPVAPNLLNQTFAPTAPNQVWVADLTYVATQEGWLYLAGIKDVYTCEIVGYAMGERMTKELTGKALFMALRSQRPLAGLIHCVFRSIRSRIGIEVRSAIRIHSINRELNFFYRFLTRFFAAFHYRGIFPQ